MDTDRTNRGSHRMHTLVGSGPSTPWEIVRSGDALASSPRGELEVHLTGATPTVTESLDHRITLRDKVNVILPEIISV